MARLFLAIWPDDAALERLARLAQEVALVAGGKPVERSKIHLTLVFLGEVGQARAAAIGGAARVAAGGAGFELVLDRVGSFRRSGVAWAGASVEPPQLLALQSKLEAGLRGAGFALEERPYRPHLTLARKIARPLPAAAIEPIRLACDGFALVRSEARTDGYTSLESWPLG